MPISPGIQQQEEEEEEEEKQEKEEKEEEEKEEKYWVAIQIAWYLLDWQKICPLNAVKKVVLFDNNMPAEVSLSKNKHLLAQMTKKPVFDL